MEMKNERYVIWKKGEYTYPAAYGFVPNLMAYLHEDDTVRPCMVVVPGGGYAMVSPTEGEIVAKKFYEKGYQAFVLTYTVNPLENAPLKEQPMRDLLRAICFLRKSAAKLQINPAQVVICGFSAGGHLCGSACVHYRDVEEENEEFAAYSGRPDAAVLSYPVITSGTYAHRGSFDCLLGRDATQEELQYMSLETQVTGQTPPIFLWHTADDGTVPVENSYRMAEALKKNGVNCALHIFSKGHHGLSLANAQWANHEYGEPYTLEQIRNILLAVQEGTLSVPENTEAELRNNYGFLIGEEDSPYCEEITYPEIMVWPEMADGWLKSMFLSNKTE